MKLRAIMVISVLGWALPARGDGIPAYLDRTGWHVLDEPRQDALVALRDGRELLLLQVRLGAEAQLRSARRLVWVVPVPAPAAQVKVDILRGFPQLTGVEPRGQLRERMRAALLALSLTQLYPLPLVALTLGMRAAPSGVAPELVVFKRLRRHGLELELIEARTRAALQQHLRQRGADLPAAALRGLAGYLGRGRCFVLFRIADLPAYQLAVSDQPDLLSSLGVQIDFPAREGFYPLVASAGLPGSTLEVVVTVLGFVEPSSPAPAGLQHQHYIGRLDASGPIRAALPDYPVDQDLRYTRLRIQASPAELTRDLRFRPGAPLSTRLSADLLLARRFGLYFWLAALGLFLLCSVVASLAARRAWPVAARPGGGMAALLGLANLGSLVGLLGACILRARLCGLPWTRGLLVGLLTSLIFTSLLAICFLLLLLIR